MSSDKATEIRQKLANRLSQHDFTKGRSGDGIEHWETLTDLVVTALFAGGHILLTDHRSSGLAMLMKSIAESTVSLENYDHVHCDPFLSASELPFLFLRDPGSAFRIVFLENFPEASQAMQSKLLDVIRSREISSSRHQSGHVLIVATQDHHSTKKIKAHGMLESFLFHEEVPELKEDDEKNLLAGISAHSESVNSSPAFNLEEIVSAREEIRRAIDISDELQEQILKLAKEIGENEHTETYGGPSTICLKEFHEALKAWVFWKGASREGNDAVDSLDVTKLAPKSLGHRIIRKSNAIASPNSIVVRSLRQSDFSDPDHQEDEMSLEILENMSPEDSAVKCYEIYKNLKKRLELQVFGRSDDGPEIPGSEDNGLSTIDLVLTALFAGGHVLLEDFPGTGKSYLANVLGNSIEDDKEEEDFDIPSFNRIQCTPDLLPQDITGGQMLKDGTTEMYFKHGPVFAYVVLVDEINRTTPKVQSGLLEAMAEQQVTIEGKTYPLGSLFFCIATQNPLDKVGTFELPAAQLDRFLFKRRLKPITEEAVQKVMTMDLNLGSNARSEELPKQVKLTEVVAVRDYLLEAVELEGVNDESCTANSLPVFLRRLARKFKQMEDSDDPKEKLQPGSMPSPRTLKRLVKVMQIQAFVQAEGKLEEMVVRPEHLRPIAADLLRHRIFPTNLEGQNEYEKETELDRRINKVIQEALEEHNSRTQVSE